MIHPSIGLLVLASLLLSGPALAGELLRAGFRAKSGPERVSQRALRPHAALSEFHFGYVGGADHKLHALVVQGGTGGARFELSDGRNPRQQGAYDARATWYQDDALAGRTATVRQRCRVRCLIPVPPTDGRWVLGGFSLRRPGDKEDHVLRIAVQVTPDQRHVEVVFRDKGRDVDFDAIVDLVSVPKRLIRRSESPKGQARGEKGSQTVLLGRPRRGEIPVLAGFDVRFLNSDHKFRALSLVEHGQRATRSVLFWDARPDDPFEAALRIVYLAGSR